MVLADELTKPEYQTGTYAERLALLHSKTAPAVGKIRGDKIKLLQSFIGATQLRARLANATPEQAAAAASVAEAIQPAYLAAEDTFSINLADPQVAGLLSNAVAAGLISANESAYLTSLATYQRQLWPDVTLRDVVAHFEPALVDVGEWAAVTQLHTSRLMLKTTEALPEPETVRIEMRESHNGVDWSNWRRITSFNGVLEAGIYYQQIPFNGLQREIRWRGERYRVIGTVEAV